MKGLEERRRGLEEKKEDREEDLKGLGLGVEKSIGGAPVTL